MGRFARYYDLEYRDFDEDFSLYHNLARRFGSPVLELACGSGRVVLSLAGEGYEVYGVDVSAEMLLIAEQRAQEKGLGGKIHLLHGDMVDPPIPAGLKFNLVLLAVNSFMYLTAQERQVQVLRLAGKVLAKGGLLVLDLANPFTTLTTIDNGELIHQLTLTDDDTTVVKFVSREANLAEQLEHITCFYDEVGHNGDLRRTVVPFTLRHLFRYEAEMLLENAGFCVEGVYGSYDLEEYESSSERMIVLAGLHSPSEEEGE